MSPPEASSHVGALMTLIFSSRLVPEAVWQVRSLRQILSSKKTTLEVISIQRSLCSYCTQGIAFGLGDTKTYGTQSVSVPQERRAQPQGPAQAGTHSEGTKVVRGQLGSHRNLNNQKGSNRGGVHAPRASFSSPHPNAWGLIILDPCSILHMLGSCLFLKSACV